MANQAFGRTEDLLFGSGELYISLNDDEDGWKHLGNVDEFVITTTVDSLEKNSSMNTKRELQSKTTTALSVTAEATLTEYDYKNVAMALFGDIDNVRQTGRKIVNRIYSISSVPGLITMVDGSNNRYYGIRDISVVPRISINSRVYWSDANDFGDLSTISTYNDTFTQYGVGGRITIDLTSSNIERRYSIYVCITQAPDEVGDLLGMKAQIFDGSNGLTTYKDFSAGMEETVWLSGDVSVTFSVQETDTFSAMSLITERGIKATAVPIPDEYVNNYDYVADEQSCRAGIIKIPEGSRIREGDRVSVSCTVPYRDLYIVHSGTKKDIIGQLLFVSDANTGPNYVIEGWKVHIYPEGDLAGLISSGDFGSYKIKFSFLTDYENHPSSPHFSMTLVDYGQQDINSGTYNAEY